LPPDLKIVNPKQPRHLPKSKEKAGLLSVLCHKAAFIRSPSRRFLGDPKLRITKVCYIEENAAQDQETPVFEHQQKFQLHKQFWMLNEQGIDIIEHTLNLISSKFLKFSLVLFASHHSKMISIKFDYKPVQGNGKSKLQAPCPKTHRPKLGTLDTIAVVQDLIRLDIYRV
jgi:hypothetical protein